MIKFLRHFGKEIASFFLTMSAMYLFFVLIIYVLTGLTGCGKKGEKEDEPQEQSSVTTKKSDKKEDKEPEPCTVEDISTGAIITCPDGSTVVINDGLNGQDGEDAPVCTFEVVQTCE